MKILRKDKISLLIVICLIITIISGVIFSIITINHYYSYRKDVNTIAANIVEKIKEKYPDVKEEELLEIFNSPNSSNTKILERYGIDDEISAFSNLEKDLHKSFIIDIVIIIIISLSFLVVFIIYLIYRDKKIGEITNYIEEINNKNYNLKISDEGEGELSRLKSELCKITSMLKEENENNLKEKKNLSDAVSDISHQIKTPLTSIQIMLDNIIEDKNMKEDIKNDFIMEINKQIEWINFLVISLLKLARFDAGVMEFKKEKIDVQKLLKKVKENLAITAEINNVDIVIDDNSAIIEGDFGWQAEALTNIVKNCIEHSNDGSEVTISVEDNLFYTGIKIKDTGTGMNKKDLQNIFKRFYKGKNSSNNSIGIGLNLAKAIIEKDNGYITCDSKENIGTTFHIKYMKK